MVNLAALRMLFPRSQVLAGRVVKPLPHMTTPYEGYTFLYTLTNARSNLWFLKAP